MTIKKKILITIVLALLLSVAVITGFASNLSSSAIKNRLELIELPAVLGSVSASIQSDLIGPITVARGLATNPENLRFMEQGEPAAQLPQLTNYLSQVKLEYQALSSFFISAQTGHYYTESGLFKTLSRSSSRDSWFYEFVNSGKLYELTFDVDEVSGESTLFINYSVRKDGQLVAVTGIGLSMGSASDKIRNKTVGDSGMVFLTDQEGKIKLHPEPSHLGKHLSEFATLTTSSLLNKEHTTFLEAEAEGVPSLFAAQYLPELDWFVVAKLPSSEVYGEVTRSLFLLVITGIVIGLISVAICFYLINSLVKPLDTVATMLEDISSGDGDLTQRLDDSRQDEVGKLSRGYNSFVDSLEQLIAQVRGVSLALHQLTESVAMQMRTVEQDVNSQQQQTEQVATAIQEMGHTVQEIASSASKAAEHARLANADVQKGNSAVQQTIERVDSMGHQIGSTSERIQQLASDASSIDTVLDVIRGVSEQTNLLALNAAIEAARAGEQGRGFAVVADEVRTLAQRSHESTEEIKTIIEKLQQSSTSAVEAMQEGVEITGQSQDSAAESGAKLVEISEAIHSMNDMSTQIATATEEQSTVVDEVSNFITAIADIAQANATHSSEAIIDCEKLMQEADKLKHLVSQFKLRA